MRKSIVARKMSGDAFSLIEQAARVDGPERALDLLASIAAKERNNSLLFEARLLKARHRLGLPLIFNGSLEDLPEGARPAYEQAMRAAAEETGALCLADGDIPRAWPYFRALGDPAPVSEAIEKIDSHEQLDAIIEIAYSQGVNPRKGFELLLKQYGICRAITFFPQYPDPKTRDQCAMLLLRTLHGELLENLKRAISGREGRPPDGGSVSELIRGRDWLFGDLDYYVDTSHLASIIPWALDLADAQAVDLAIELCDYGTRLSRNFQSFRTDPPFDDFFKDHAIYLRALAGRDQDAAVAHFRSKAADSGPDAAGAGPAQVLVMLLARLKRYREALDAALEYLSDQDPGRLICPSIPQLCQLAGDHGALAEVAKRQRDLLSFTAAAITPQAL